MMPPLSPEFRLAAACCIWPPSHYRNEAIYEAAEAPINWALFLRVVRRHRIEGFVYDALRCIRLIVPSEIDRELGATAIALVRQNLELAGEGLRLQHLFAEADLPVVFVKGASLAMLAYGTLSLRHSRDLDLVVFPNSMSAAGMLLERAGYRRREPPTSFNASQLRMWMLRCKELTYIHEQQQIIVELHSRLFDNPLLMADTLAAAPLRMVAVTGRRGLCTFGEEDLFAYLCAHGAIHCWFRLKWLADIGALLARQSATEIERLYQAAEARGVGQCAAQAIVLCKLLLGMEFTEKVIATARKNASVRWLTSIAIQAITADLEPTEQLFGTARNNLSHFLLAFDIRYWLGELRNHLISPVDILTIPLPARLSAVYPIVRVPLWLWRHCVRRASSPQNISNFK
jgi:putative nucleotidyltransferase-like protein